MKDVPAAFRKPQPQKPQRLAPGYIGMEDEQVLKVAANALRMVQTLPLGSRPRVEQWGTFDGAMSELRRRAVNHVARKIREYGRGLPPAHETE